MVKKTTKKFLLSLLCVFLALLTVVIGYAAYVLLSYYRLEDYIALPVSAARADAKESGKADVPCRVTALKTETSYTATTFNIGFGAYTPDFTFFMDGGKQSRAASKESVETHVNSALNTIKEFNPDFALFQEVDTSSTRSYHVNEKETAQNAFSEYASVFAVNYHSAYLMYPLHEPHGKSNSGILTFSKNGFSSALRRSLPIADDMKKLLDLDRCYSVTRVPLDNGKELVLYNVHLSAYGGSDEIREGQLNMLLSDMKSEYEKGNYCVCGGDFNHDFTGDSTQKLNGGEGNSFGWAQPLPADILDAHGISRAINYDELVPTCRNCDVPYKKGNFTVIVDGFLVSQNVEVKSVKNVDTGFSYSDHNPVVMSFKLK